MRLLCRGTSAAAVKRLGEKVLCLRLLGHDRLGATNFGLGAAGNDTRIGPGNARIGPKTIVSVREQRLVGAADLIGSRGRPLKGLSETADFERFWLQKGTPGPPAPGGVLQEGPGK